MPAKIDLSFRTAPGRWARLGPYYAMFPFPFVADVMRLFAQPGQTVVDPFCGRGTVPFLAMIHNMEAIATDINPVAWVYSKTKTDPYPRLEGVTRRLDEIREAVVPDDRRAEHRFQELAFCGDVRAFIRAARRELDWRHCRLDRTVAAFLLQHLHDKRGRGLSNQMRSSRALSPDYCIRWWCRQGHDRPPEIEAHTFLQRRAAWRYAKGIAPTGYPSRPRIALGSAHDALPEVDLPVDLVLTSPPYCNVTNYRSDNWLRLWALDAGPSLPDWDPAQKFVDPRRYRAQLTACLLAVRERSSPQTVWYIRSDARPRTLNVIADVMRRLLPDHRRYEHPAPYRAATQTALYGDKTPKPGEIDLLYMPKRKRRRGFTQAFIRT